MPDGRAPGRLRDAPPFARLPGDGAEDGRCDIGVGEGDVVGRRRYRAGLPARRLRARDQRDLQRVGGAEASSRSQVRCAEAARDRELVAAGRRVEVDHADGRAPFNIAHVPQ